MVNLKRLTDLTDGAVLVVTLHNLTVNGSIPDRPLGRATLRQKLQPVLLVKALDRPGGYEISSQIQWEYPLV